jgi:hypothetical protein
MKDNHFQEVLLPLHIKLQGLYKRMMGPHAKVSDTFVYESWTGMIWKGGCDD